MWLMWAGLVWAGLVHEFQGLFVTILSSIYVNIQTKDKKYVVQLKLKPLGWWKLGEGTPL